MQCSLLLLFPFLYAIRSNINDWFEAIIIGKLVNIARGKYGEHVSDLVVSVSHLPDDDSIKQTLESVDAETRSESEFEELVRNGTAREAIKLDGLSHVASIICAVLFAAYMLYFWLLVSTGITYPSLYTFFLDEVGPGEDQVRILLDRTNILRIPHILMGSGCLVYLYFSCKFMYLVMEAFSQALKRDFDKLKKWMVCFSIGVYVVFVLGLFALCWFFPGSFTSWFLSMFIVLIIIISYTFVYITFTVYTMVLNENLNGD